MIIFPAIDLKDGHCVRLLQGEMSKATIFSDNPASQAQSFEKAGFEWIHIVDLNGAFAGKPVNIDSVREIISSITVPLQLGGGIRDIATIEAWLQAGVKRVILGTVALRDPDLVREACKAFPGAIAVGIDAREGFVAVEGWAEHSLVKVEDLALKFEDAGVAAIIYTDIQRDGLMSGPDFSGTKALAERISTPVIASGGVSSVSDIVKLKKLEPSGVIGAIMGRALYDGRVTPEEALKASKS